MRGAICADECPARIHRGRPRFDPRAEAEFYHALFQESRLVWARWAVAAILTILPLSATTRQDVAARSLPLILLALGNGLIARQLKTRSATTRSMRHVQWHATLLEWATALAVTVEATPSVGVTMSILQILVLLAAVRFGLTGIAVASSGVALAVGIYIGAHVFILEVIAIETLPTLVTQHTALLICGAIILAALTQAGRSWRRREEERWDRFDAATMRVRSGLSAQELNVLNLLHEDDLTYASIGSALHISGETVKTNVRRIGGKWGVSGRRQVVAEAHRRNLLPPRTSVSQDEWRWKRTQSTGDSLSTER